MNGGQSVDRDVDQALANYPSGVGGDSSLHVVFRNARLSRHALSLRLQL